MTQEAASQPQYKTPPQDKGASNYAAILREIEEYDQLLQERDEKGVYWTSPEERRKLEMWKQQLEEAKQ